MDTRCFKILARFAAGAFLAASALGLTAAANAADIYFVNKTVDPLTLYIKGARACEAAPGAECKAESGAGAQLVRVSAPDGKTLETELTLGRDPLRWTVFYGDPRGRTLAGRTATTKTAMINKRPVRRTAGGTGPWFVQLGSFSDRGNAEKLAARAAPLGAVDVQPATVRGRTWHRVRMGPAANRKEALAIWVQARKSGFPVAQIVRN